MHLKWLEDLLAVAKAPSLTEAAQSRRVTQPAFSRRLRALEDWLGTDVIDRSRKSGCLTAAAQVHLDQIEGLVAEFHRLKKDIETWTRTHGRLVLVAQHSLATTMLPRLVVALRANEAIAELRVQAADMDECRALLASGEADILVAYHALGDTTPGAGTGDTIRLATDDLIAVAAPGVAARLHDGLRRRLSVDVVGYPAHVFFGSLLHGAILPVLGQRCDVRIRCETALASGVMELALAELGVGWLPRMIAEENLVKGRLVDLTALLGGVPLGIVATRSPQNANPLIADAWRDLTRVGRP